jgi:RHS repeat-associated protein
MRRLYTDAVDALFTRIDSGGSVAWYLTDRLGSVRDLANNTTGASIDHFTYDGFGNATQTQSANGDRYEFTAREFDSESNLQYNRDRYYDPTTGRWTSEDRLSFNAGDSNLYRFVHNCPTNFRDPLGQEDLKIVVEDIPSPQEGGLDARYSLVVSWHVPKGKNGYIVQHIMIDSWFYQATKYKPGKGPHDGCWECTGWSQVGAEYWEAWKVEDGKVYTIRKDGTKVLSDRDTLHLGPGVLRGVTDNGICKEGGGAVWGNVKFLENYKLDKDDGWGYDVPQAGRLLATKKRPKGWTDEGSVDHHLVVTFTTYDWWNPGLNTTKHVNDTVDIDYRPTK